ncbi:DNA-binding MarR family transcriptional regulator [Sphingopyxis panaciterrae]|uniref:MarR family transcriptional regulator n=1 Tax=Sphingopyxis panaciterrae TaxID=363841 RepID=UPI001422F036|nr:MarR family transcriptional regulator [Sphingopyxis panaciterrae]NIJ35716.1 DNA-binding MarR family transcriptional regulator [Sphingopyxis panaciterrae]
MRDRPDDARKVVGITPNPGVLRAVEALSRAAARNSSVAEKLLVEGARQLLRARLKMARIAPPGLLRDSAWDMMLELFISGEEGGILYVKQLMLASGESSTAAMRRIDRLEEAGFLERFPDPLDRRRVIVRLKERGRSAMLAMLEHVFEPDAPVAHHEERAGDRG